MSQPPAAPAAITPRPPYRAPALRRRLACLFYEGLLLFGVIFLAGFVFSVATQTRHALDNRLGMQVFVFAVLGLYFAWLWSGPRQTLPMKTWHMRLVTRDGAPLRFGHALWRYVLAWVWVAPPLLALAPYKLRAAELSVLTLGWVAVWALLSRFHPQQQFWHDVLAGTRLVDVQPNAARRRQ